MGVDGAAVIGEPPDPEPSTARDTLLMASFPGSGFEFDPSEMVPELGLLSDNLPSCFTPPSVKLDSKSSDKAETSSSPTCGRTAGDAQTDEALLPPIPARTFSGVSPRLR